MGLLNEAQAQLQIANKAGTISSLLNSNLGRPKKSTENGRKTITKSNQAKHWDFPGDGGNAKQSLQ